MRLIYLQVLKHQERLNDIKKGTKDDFRGGKKLSKVKPMYLEAKLTESIFSLISLEIKKQNPKND